MSNLRDFYLRPETDPAFRPEQLEVYDELESCLQQIKMTLFTQKGEVLGEPEFGLEVEKYLFEFTIDPFALTKEAGGQITKYVTRWKKKNGLPDLLKAQHFLQKYIEIVSSPGLGLPDDGSEPTRNYVNQD